MSEKELDKCGCGSNCGCGDNHGHDHECGCGCVEHEHEHFVIDLEDDNGNIISCPIIDAFEYEEAEYVLAQNTEDNSVYLFKASENGELSVPEEDEFERVSKYYEEVLANE